MSVNSLSNKENGKRPVKDEDREKLADIYGCDPFMLLKPPPSAIDESRTDRINVLLERLTTKQIEVWISLGESLLNASE